MGWRRCILMGLLALLTLQIPLWIFLKRAPQLSGPMDGDTLANVRVSMFPSGEPVSLNDALRRKQSCAVVFAISTTCPTCARLRWVWPQHYRTWVDSVGVLVPVIWIIGGKLNIVENFLEGFYLPGVSVVTVPKDDRGLWKDIGVFATPMSYLTNREAVVRGGVAGTSFPEARLAREVCMARPAFPAQND